MKKKIRDVVSGYFVDIHTEKLRGKTVYCIESPTLGVADFGYSIEEAKTQMEEAIRCFTKFIHPDEPPIPEPDIKTNRIQKVQVSDEKTRLELHA